MSTLKKVIKFGLLVGVPLVLKKILEDKKEPQQKKRGFEDERKMEIKEELKTKYASIGIDMTSKEFDEYFDLIEAGATDEELDEFFEEIEEREVRRRYKERKEKFEEKEFKRKEEERKERSMQLQNENKRKEEERKEKRMQQEAENKRKKEEQKKIQGLSVIKVRCRIEFFDKNGRSSGTRNIDEEMLVDVVRRTAFQRGDIDSWVSARYPGGKAKNISVTGQRPCTIEDYYRLRHTL